MSRPRRRRFVRGPADGDRTTSDGHRNLTIEGVVADLGGGDQDAITLKYGTHHVWIDHCDLRAQPVGEPFVVDGSEDYYDGLLDITRGCDFITVSWTKFTDSWKAMLIGGGSGEVENIGKQHVTLYNNYFLDCLERGPYVGLSQAHVFNDYTRVTRMTGSATTPRSASTTATSTTPSSRTRA